ncbi:hypothetical protein JGH11_14360 [Dysgonomonas sp. Marseille-P4677]|uniref:GxGYxYP domain-containing protein n=1 Tax=Dysgonomonas sp. Marseille-P4677 TaxID=2364790 RepID=UPI001913B61F|nr:GxGYxYP domain-containing protein [Dysgonomonas sp. Marseille-P4677]MBK5722059.1 hypothetical protein [Dysgonomonas sp. Marseille-P4677]
MKLKILPILGVLLITISSCNSDSSLPNTKAPESTVDAEKERGVYADKYDAISDAGQYTFPEMKIAPKKYWSCVGVLTPNGRNDLGKTNENEGLQYHLLCQSISGLTNRAVDEGKSDIGVWLYDHENRDSYKLSLEALQSMGIKEQGMQTGTELALNDYGPSDGIDIRIKDLFDGYILTDVENNPESNIVASVASHVYNSIIVDIRDKDKYDAAGYEMKYDARFKTTRDSWKEFKDKCNNKALVVMPVQTGELRDFAIKNNLFVLNINKLNGNASSGQNLDIFEEVLKWLNPGAPIFGWEQGVGEDLFVNRASKTGHVWVPSDWTYNIPMASLQYSKRQTSILAKVKNPLSIDFDKKKNFVSFYLTDGDNIQWMMNNFIDGFYNDTDANNVKMSFGIPVGNLAMISPPQFSNIVNLQKDNYTLIESLGGGYSYVDNYAVDANRTEKLYTLARNVAASMRQHRIKILGLIAHNVRSTDAQAGFKAFIEANDQLEGIVAIQYSPYAGGEGDIFWVKNKNGFDIPIVTVKYSLWNHGSQNHSREGTPAFVANRLKSEAKDISFSFVAVHAWSNFKYIGTSNDELAENQGGNIKGAGAAKLCVNHLNNDFDIVNAQELIWRIRMFYKESQTKQYLAVIK